MNYYFTTIIKGNFNTTIQDVTKLLKEKGFGVLTHIDIKEILKDKLNVNFRKYKILGACNPSFAYKALSIEDKIGTMLPCNIIIQEISESTIEISAINPLISMQSVKNKQLNNIAIEVSAKLESIIKSIKNEE